MIHFFLSLLFHWYLEEKLSKVENEYQEKLKVFQLDKNQGMEERLIAMQKKYEMEKKHELGEEVPIQISFLILCC